jgi:hypothetical protein
MEVGRAVQEKETALLRRSSAHPFLAFAHLALCAAAILARPSALIFLRGGLVVVVAFELTGRPRFTGAV